MNSQNSGEYLFLFRGNHWYHQLSGEELQKAMSQFQAWFERLSAEGKLKASQPLVPEGRLVSGKQGRVVSDGPFAESKEAIGGYFLIKADSLDEAVAIAKGCPALEFGVQVEVRPAGVQCPMAERLQALRGEGQLATVS